MTAWTREERHFRHYPTEVVEQVIPNYQGIEQVFTPTLINIVWYSTYQGWSLGEVQANGLRKAPSCTDEDREMERLPGKWTGPLEEQHVMVKIISGTKRSPEIPQWLLDLIEETKPLDKSKFVNDEQLGWVAKT
jgi:hypothetical protein